MESGTIKMFLYSLCSYERSETAVFSIFSILKSYWKDRKAIFFQFSAKKMRFSAKTSVTVDSLR
jgi:hypothetical protein